MAKIKLNGDTSGYIEISAPAVSGNNTLELGPGTKILTNLDNTFTGVSTFTSGLHVTGGSFGLGTDNPDATLKVNVASGNNGVVVQNTSDANIALLGARNGDATVQIGQWGSTASGSTFGLSNADLSFIYTTSYSTTHPSALALGTVSNKPIVFATNNTERVRISSGGNVGINETAPDRALHVNSGATDTALKLESTDAEVSLELTDNTGSSYIGGGGSYLNFYSGGNERLRIRSDGRVTIGTQTINTNSMLSIHRGSSDECQIRFTNTTTGEGGNNGLLVGIDSNEHGRIFNQENTPLRFGTNNTERVRISSDGKFGIGVQSPFSRFQSGGHTFSGTNGFHTNDRVGMSNHGNLTGLMLASTYNDSAHPEYGLVFVQGPNTSSYNVWGLCPDGPAKGNSLNLHYGAQSSNIHSPSNRKFQFTGDGYLLKPNHPSFRVGRHTDYSHTGGQPVQFNQTTGSAHLNQGNHYNTSTHRFTAPVAGVYQFSACIIVNGLANPTDVTDLFYLYKNGSHMAYSMRRARYVSNYTGTGGYYVDFLSNVNILMAANDYCDIRVRLSLSVHGNATYTWFSGTLVG